MYESPVKIAYDDMSIKMLESIDNQITATIQQIVSVDKYELIRALKYDRGQYEKGYEDGQRDAEVKHGTWKCIDNHEFNGDIWRKWYCTNCGYIRTQGWRFTQNGRKPTALFCEGCGAKMDGKGK